MSTITNASLAYTGLCIDIGNENSPGDVSASSSRTVSNPLASLRSSSSMHGLVQAELGGYMVEKCLEPTGSGFKEGQKIQLDSISPNLCTTAPKPPIGSEDFLVHPEAQVSSLSRHGTLITAGANPARNSAELQTILGNHSRLRPGATVLQSLGRSEFDYERTYLEQAKPRARVEVDIALESPVCVQGGYLSGNLKVRVRHRTKKEAAIMLSGGKIRVIGFECIRNESERHTFYLCSSSLSSITDASHEMFDSSADEEGFAYAREGVHSFPFSMHLPLDSDIGNAKGVILNSHTGAAIRYIVMFSLQVREAETGRRSIAHFYRDCEIWPRLNPSVVLAPASVPIQATSSKSLFMGGTGKITLTAILHRLHWVAGQQCYVKVNIANFTKKIIKSLTLTLFRTTVVFKPRPHLNVETNLELDADACLTSTSQKQVAESMLEMGQCPGRGHASAKGWWVGVQGGQTMNFSHFLLLPPDALSIARTRLLEVEYTLRVSASAGALTSDVDVALPIRILNFLSIDPPPCIPSAPCSTIRQQSASQTSTRSYVTGTQRNNSVILESLEECENEDSSEDLAADEHDVDSTDPKSPDDGEELALGNLAIHDDTDAVVQYAITSAKIDTKYAQSATRFADLYYTSLQEDADGAPEDVPPDSSEGTAPSDSAVSRTKCHSSFAQRVQHKLQTAKEDGRLKSVRTTDLVTATDSVSPLPSTHGSYFRPREDMPDEVERDYQPPISRQCSDAESSESSASAGSRFSFIRTESDSSQSSNDVALELNPRGSRVPSRPSCLVPQQPFGRLRAQTIAACQPSASIIPGGRSHSSSSFDPGNPRPTLVCMSASSCNSVKDRIRQLEERVQAERKLEMGGPL